ncbi:hypothetical protein KO566_02875 [Flavobacteriaceae bacterium XHP0103]|uniref:hypothetical protein n=1 Tax=Marixanthotalea marina TaxID=2844359 RepID=UPI002989ED13|nr:hypothetical protein [Marixanthotalea marina]MBU3820991.1 hypothetical protein [Marixanthotalea marina]
MDSKGQEIMDYLSENVFNPILESDKASKELKKGVRYTIMRMEERDTKGMFRYYWSAIIGTEKSTKFAKLMKKEGFTRFEELIDDFRERFNDRWLRS